ncbi:hypothetical protein BHM03_00027990, partial [Ensete ventricosum]
ARYGQPPLVGVTRAVAPCSLAAGGSPLLASRSWSCPQLLLPLRVTAPCGLLPYKRPPLASDHLLQGAWPQLAAPL